MIGRCSICGERLHWTRSRSFCTSHYWRLRRLREKPRFELQRLAREAECNKRLIEIVLDEPTQEAVADPLRGNGLP